MTLDMMNRYAIRFLAPLWLLVAMLSAKSYKNRINHNYARCHIHLILFALVSGACECVCVLARSLSAQY